MAQPRRSLWRANAAAVLALLIVVAASILVDVLAPGASVELLPVAGLVLGVVPAVVWLVLFYRLDSAEPEPRRLVVGVFALGALLAAAVGVPLIDGVFRVRDWLGADTLVQLLGSILVIGFTQEFLKYLAVRLTVYDTAEFDEMADGVIYGTAAGLGYATVLSIALVLASGGIGLGLGAVTVTVIALGHGSFGGLVGYFVAGQKLRRRPIWWTSVGLAVGATLNGLFFTLRSIVTTGGLQVGGVLVGPLLGLILATIFAVAVAAVLVRLTRRGRSAAVPDSVAR